MASWGSPAQSYCPRSPGNEYQNIRQNQTRFPQNSPNFRPGCEAQGPYRGRNCGYSHTQRQYHPYHQDVFKSPTSSQPRQFTLNGHNISRTQQSVIWNDRSQSRSSPKRFPETTNYNHKSPRYDSKANYGGSNNIEIYYDTSMLDDPWRDLIPVPVSHSPSTTT